MVVSKEYGGQRMVVRKREKIRAREGEMKRELEMKMRIYEVFPLKYPSLQSPCHAFMALLHSIILLTPSDQCTSMHTMSPP